MINRLLSPGFSYGEMESAVGKLRIITTSEGLAGIGWDNVHQTTEGACKWQGLIRNQHGPKFRAVKIVMKTRKSDDSR